MALPVESLGRDSRRVAVEPPPLLEHLLDPGGHPTAAVDDPLRVRRHQGRPQPGR